MVTWFGVGPAFFNRRKRLTSILIVIAFFLAMHMREKGIKRWFIATSSKLGVSLANSQLPSCSHVAVNKRQNLDLTGHSWHQLQSQLSWVLPGGYITPSRCRAQQRVALIIPYRRRDLHLRLLLRHLFPVLRAQSRDAHVIVVEQRDPARFNKAMLMNVAVDILRRGPRPPDCVILHDVDMLPEHFRATYACAEGPLHVPSAIDKWGYKLMYKELIGGVLALSMKVFVKLNGFSNNFIGWGGEDDDMYHRIKYWGYNISRPSPEVGRFTMLNHKKDKGNEVSKDRHKAWFTKNTSYVFDGLSSLHGAYYALEISQKPLFTHILVSLDFDKATRNFKENSKVKIGEIGTP